VPRAGTRCDDRSCYGTTGRQVPGLTPRPPNMAVRASSAAVDDVGSGRRGYASAWALERASFLIALGPILALAVDINVSGINLQLVVWILALVGVVSTESFASAYALVQIAGTFAFLQFE
jgi:hypothetical protein